MARTESRPRSRPNAALRVAFRLPVYPYRYRLGWLFGHRLLLLVHRGRKSGYVYQTVLEVVRHDPARRESIVVSAWGERRPTGIVISGRLRRWRSGSDESVTSPTQRFLTPEEVYAEIADYERRHPWLARTIHRWLGFPLDGTQAARKTLAMSVRMVAFRPRPR